MGWRGPGLASVRPSTVGCTAWYIRSGEPWPLDSGCGRGKFARHPVARHNLVRAEPIEDSVVAWIRSGAMLRRDLPVPVGPRHRRCPLEFHRRALDRNLFTALGSIRMAFSTRKWGNFLCSQSA
jgi:hypothetical protein